MTDKFLGVGGTDGTNARPLKIDVDGNLEVKDIDVKAELELIKDQQAEILSRLGEPIDTQLTGSNIADGLLTRQKNDYVVIHDDLDVIPPGSSRYYELKFSSFSMQINYISLVGRLTDTNRPKFRVRNLYPMNKTSWNTTVAMEKDLVDVAQSVGIMVEPFKPMSQAIQIFVYNEGSTDIKLTSLGVMLWG